MRFTRVPAALSGSGLLLFALVAALVIVRSPVTAEQRALPVFIDGEAQVVPAFQDSSQWVRQQLWVETEFDSDGDGRPDRVHVTVTRPRQTETEGLKVAVIYETSPYYAGTSGARQFLWDVRQEVGAPPPPRTSQPAIAYRGNRTSISGTHVNTWVPRGFAVVHSESPGTGLSQGCPTVGGPNESLAPKAVIDWLNGRARGYSAPVGGEIITATWSTGKVGMTGTSYNGTLPLAAATTGVEGLAAIIPVAPNTSYYHYYRSHGLVRHPGGWLGEDIDFLYDFINSGHPDRREYCNATIRDGEMARGRDRTTGDWNDFWAGRDYLLSVRNVKAAVLMAHAFNDWNVMPEHSVRIYEALRAQGTPSQVYFHQGGHGGAPPLQMMNRWFSRYLYGIENGVESDPRAWIVREGDPRTSPTPYPDYPNPDAAPVTLLPSGPGASVGTLSTSASPNRGVQRLIDNVELPGTRLATLPASGNRLLFSTAALAAPVHISGTPRVNIRLAASKPAANLSVWLVHLGSDSAGNTTAGVITRGWADPQNHSSLTRGEPLSPGQFVNLSFTLQPDDQIVAAGERIALMIFSSDRDFTLWPEPGTELAVDLDATQLILPIVGGAAAFNAANRSPADTPSGLQLPPLE